MTRAWRVGLACGLVGALTLRTADAQQPASSPAPAAGRPTRTTAVAGVHYKAGWFHRWLLGTHYRDLWATPVEVEQLDLSRFAGGRARPVFLPGMVEEPPTEPPEDDVGCAGAVDLAGTKKLFEYLERDARNRVDSRACLGARLMDVCIGDWDCHQGQWRWARFDVG